MADKNSRFQLFRERKRLINEIREAFLNLSNLLIEDMEQYFTDDRLNQSQMFALLVMYFGLMPLLLARYAFLYVLELCIQGVSKKVYSWEKIDKLISAQSLRKPLVEISSLTSCGSSDRKII